MSTTITFSTDKPYLKNVVNNLNKRSKENIKIHDLELFCANSFCTSKEILEFLEIKNKNF